MSREEEITRGIRKSDIKAFESLFRSSYPPLVRYAKTILKDNDTAEEIVQDLFYRLWKDREKLKIESTLNGYLFRSVHNRALHYLKHKGVMQKFEADMAAAGGDTPATPLETIQYSELNELVVKTIEKLPERCGEIFYLNRFEGLKYREIAEKLSVSVKTVEANMGRALKEFRRAISGL
ncbi:MAG: RNA polymerase sigma-70 factor [Bacteroidales bacterium]|jgi:RNA polymerase sigma-70 factor (ECF subfamily)|nr:RNA polymerase sigma-70 factor [Bacteroidales bacterium]